MTSGYINIRRSIDKHPVLDKPWKQGMFRNFIAQAVWEDDGRVSMVNGLNIKLYRGEFILNISEIADGYDYERSKVRRFIDSLSKNEMIEKRQVGKVIVCILVNYNKYNGEPTSKRPVDDHNLTSKRPVKTPQKQEKISVSETGRPVDDQQTTSKRPVDDHSYIDINNLTKITKDTSNEVSTLSETESRDYSQFKNKPFPKNPDKYPWAFLLFWSEYPPNETSAPVAYKKWLAACKDYPPEYLLEKVILYEKHRVIANRQPAHATTWFNQKRYEVDYETLIANLTKSQQNGYHQRSGTTQQTADSRGQPLNPVDAGLLAHLESGESEIRYGECVG